MKKIMFLVPIIIYFQVSYSQPTSSGKDSGVSWRIEFDANFGTAGAWNVYLTNHNSYTVGVYYNATYYQASTGGLINKESRDGIALKPGQSKKKDLYIFPKGYGDVIFKLEDLEVRKE